MAQRSGSPEEGSATPGLPDGGASQYPRVSLVRSLVLAAFGWRTFLGAWWVRLLLALTPPSWRPGLALRLVGLAPYYFHGRNLGGAAHRSRVSREMFVRDVLEPYLAPEQDLLDVGCGPGYLARAVSGRVWSVAAVDVSRGVLACARVLNPAINIDYRTPREFFGSGRRVDIAVSLTMASRLGDDELSALLSSVRASVRPGGRLVLQAALPDPRPTADLGSSPAPESDPESGAGPEPGLELRSARPAGRSERRRAVRGGGLRNRYLDPHHPRAAEHLVRLIERAGFADVELHLLREPDPAGRPERNCLLVAVRRHDPVPRRADRESVWPPDRVAEPAASS